MSASAMEGLPAAPTPRSAVFAVLQRVGRSLMLPITVLPAAALLLRLGQPDLLGKYTFLNFTVLAKAGGVLLDSLPLLFAVGSPSASPGGPTAPPRWPPWSATWCSTPSP